MFFAKEPLIIGHFCGNRPIKIIYNTEEAYYEGSMVLGACVCDLEKTGRERECESIPHYLILLDTTHLEIRLVLLNRPNINAIYGVRDFRKNAL